MFDDHKINKKDKRGLLVGHVTTKKKKSCHYNHILTYHSVFIVNVFV